MSFNIFESAKDHHLVVAHRGACGGNIPCNTMAAYEIALKQGADMIETDISRSKDGKLLICASAGEIKAKAETDNFEEAFIRIVKGVAK